MASRPSEAEKAPDVAGRLELSNWQFGEGGRRSKRHPPKPDIGPEMF
jgi:hypothetical protein